MIISSGLQRRVDTLLKGYLSQRHPVLPISNLSSSSESSTSVEVLSEQQDTKAPTSVVMEKIHRRRSLQLRDLQRSWQVCSLYLDIYCQGSLWLSRGSYLATVHWLLYAYISQITLNNMGCFSVKC